MPEQNLVILIVDRNDEIAQFNSRMLKRYGFDAFVANTAGQALAFLRDNKTSLCIFDIGLPDGNEVSLCREIRRLGTRLLFLSDKADVAEEQTGLVTEGDFYLGKPYDIKVFLVVVRSLMCGIDSIDGRKSESFVINKGVLTLEIDERKAFVNGRDVGLTPKEFSILLLLARNENNQVAYETIYRQIWGAPLNNNLVALRQQILRLRKKLSEENTDSFSILNIHSKGYVFATT